MDPFGGLPNPVQINDPMYRAVATGAGAYLPASQADLDWQANAAVHGYSQPSGSSAAERDAQAALEVLRADLATIDDVHLRVLTAAVRAGMTVQPYDSFRAKHMLPAPRVVLDTTAVIPGPVFWPQMCHWFAEQANAAGVATDATAERVEYRPAMLRPGRWSSRTTQQPAWRLPLSATVGVFGETSGYQDAFVFTDGRYTPGPQDLLPDQRDEERVTRPLVLNALTAMATLLRVA